MEITISDTGISEKRRRVLATEGFASDITAISAVTMWLSKPYPKLFEEIE